KIHGKPRLPLVFTDFMNSNDGRMPQPSGGASFRAETFDETRVGPATEEQHFQSDDTIEGPVTSLEDDSHSALAEFLEEVVTSNRAKHGLGSGMLRPDGR